ncbi:MAG: DUF3427 domain-containing protein, partial [Eggerthellales bacterium]|nr:DUF3427 domain-containing protein [Eggerthellales bacterium]
MESLQELKSRGIKGRILTTTYNKLNNPEVLRKQLEIPNNEARVFQGGFHAKGYLFNKEGVSTVIVGSSNLTQKALLVNKEWNILFHSYADGRMLKETRDEFERLWNAPESAVLSEEWISQYEEYLREKGPASKPVKPAFVQGKPSETSGTRSGEIVPNLMQEGALAELARIHEAKEPRALLISATGTGKTYLAALDVRQAKPARVLFIAHRERILEASLESFKTVLGDRYTYEIYGAGSTKPQASCVFAMVRTLQLHLNEFDPAEFDYVIVDEAHHVGAGGYRAILDYFKPAFCMGMTATPNRTDGYDVFALFNHCIAYRITLQDALDSDLLVPFHYFGIADLEIDDEVVDSKLFAKLTSSERVRHVTQKIEEYSIDKEHRCGLIFCSRNEEAAQLSRAFNELGYKTIALSGDNTDAERNRAVACLEAGELQYIFTVDIFNEGIDIPSLNQIIMLRRTESAIVFVQQLGRGLRKHDSKEYTLVLDFIGNYQKNFLVPIALSGDRTFNKDNLRRFVKEGSVVIPGCSTISFDRISEKRVMRAIDGGRFSDAVLLKAEYNNLKQELGRIPGLLDFDANGALDPLLFIAKYGSYYAFIQKYDKDYAHELGQTQVSILKMVSQKLANGKRMEDLLLLKQLVETGYVEAATLKSAASRISGRSVSTKTIDSAYRMLSGYFSAAEDLSLISRVDNAYMASDLLATALKDDEFKRLLLETIEFGLARQKANYSRCYRDTNLVLYAKYTYEEVCKLLNWEKNVNGQNIGGYKYDSFTNTYPVFINYEKDPDISDSIKYEDRFLSERELIAISKQPRTMESPEIRRLQAWPENGMKTYLFVRKNKNDADGGKEFYFLGEMHPIQKYRPFVMPGADKAAVEIWYELDDPVRADIYDYLISPLED